MANPAPFVVAPLLVFHEPLHPLIAELKDWLTETGHLRSLDHAVDQALAHNIAQMPAWGIVSGPTFLQFASAALEWIPTEELNAKHIYWMLTLFYFIFNQPALEDLQTPILPSDMGRPLSPLSSWVVRYAKAFGSHMDLPESLTPESYETFKNHPKYNLWEAELPEPGARNDGFQSFNDLFARRLRPGRRPIASANDDKVIVHAADTVFDECWDIDENNFVNCKGLDWSITGLLDGSEFANRFRGGKWIRGYLDSTDYHHVHAPVGGKVVEAKVIQGICALDIIVTEDEQGHPTLLPRRIYKPDVSDDQHEVGEAADNAGYVFLSTRGLFVIENPLLGHVAVLAVGMAHCSSVVPVLEQGAVIRKGDELCEFRFGGSDLVVVFERGANISMGSKGFHHVGEEMGRYTPPRGPAVSAGGRL